MRAYLQISCAGLGFDIGELWWTSTKDGESTSALAAIGMLPRDRVAHLFRPKLKFCRFFSLKLKAGSLAHRLYITEARFFWGDQMFYANQIL